jgi:hypothetical protein
MTIPGSGGDRVSWLTESVAAHCKDWSIPIYQQWQSGHTLTVLGTMQLVVCRAGLVRGDGNLRAYHDNAIYLGTQTIYSIAQSL